MIEEELLKHFAKNITVNKDAVVKTFGMVFNESFNEAIIEDNYEKIVPAFMFNKSASEILLTSDINPYDKRLVEYFMNEFDNNKRKKYGANNDEIFIGSFSTNDSISIDSFLGKDLYACTLYRKDNPVPFHYYKHYLLWPVLDDENKLYTEPMDFKFIFSLLYLPVNFHIFGTQSKYRLDLDEEHAGLDRKLFEYLSKDVACVITNYLHQNNKFIMDNPKTIKGFKYNPYITPRFYKDFLNELSMLFFEPKVFMSLVGEDNFKSFLEQVTNNNVEENDINSTIDAMKYTLNKRK